MVVGDSGRAGEFPDGWRLSPEPAQRTALLRGITEALEERLGVKDGQNTPDMKYTLTSVACVGCCSLAPVVMVDDKTFGRLDRKKAAKIIDNIEGGGGAPCSE